MTNEETKLIGEIGRRAHRLGIASELEAAMVVTTVHERVRKLRLDDLLKSEDHHFAHDVGGMVRLLDTDTNPPKLGGFLPRFHKR